MEFLIFYLLLTLFFYKKILRNNNFLVIIFLLFPINLFAVVNSMPSDFISLSFIYLVLIFIFKNSHDLYALCALIYSWFCFILSTLLSPDPYTQIFNNLLPFMIIFTGCYLSYVSIKKENINILSTEEIIYKLIFSTILVSICIYVKDFIFNDITYSSVADRFSFRLVGPFVDATIFCAYALILIASNRLIYILTALCGMVLAGGDGAIIVGLVYLILNNVFKVRYFFFFIGIIIFLSSIFILLSTIDLEILPSGVRNTISNFIGIYNSNDVGSVVGKRNIQMEVFIESLSNVFIFFPGVGFSSFNENYFYLTGNYQSLHNSLLQIILNFGILNFCILGLMIIASYFRSLIENSFTMWHKIIFILLAYGLAHNLLKFLPLMLGLGVIFANYFLVLRNNKKIGQQAI